VIRWGLIGGSDIAATRFAPAMCDAGAPAISGLEGLRALAFALAIKESSRSGRTVVVETESAGNAPLETGVDVVPAQ
jgi:predicted dehydrogenase